MSDFGVSAELQSSLAMCGTFVGTFKYMSPERIQNKPYNFASVSLRTLLLKRLRSSHRWQLALESKDLEPRLLQDSVTNEHLEAAAPTPRRWVMCVCVVSCMLPRRLVMCVCVGVCRTCGAWA